MHCGASPVRGIKSTRSPHLRVPTRAIDWPQAKRADAKSKEGVREAIPVRTLACELGGAREGKRALGRGASHVQIVSRISVLNVEPGRMRNSRGLEAAGAPDGICQGKPGETQPPTEARPQPLGGALCSLHMGMLHSDNRNFGDGRQCQSAGFTGLAGRQACGEHGF